MGREANKIDWIEVLRFAATIGVVFLHVVMTLNNNFSIGDIGAQNYSIFSSCYMIVKWPVPCFIMISGALLLNPDKNVTLEKILKYIKRMVIVLLLFGSVFAFMELIFSFRTINMSMIIISVSNVLQKKSWDHLWYLYVLISLYIVTIPLKCFINSSSKKTLNYLLAALVIGTFVIPSINTVTGLKLETFMIFNRYATYYLLGYYLSTVKKERWFKEIAIIGVLLSTAIMIFVECYSILIMNSEALICHSESVLDLIQATSMFILFRSMIESLSDSRRKQLDKVNKYSFAVYLVHPFWINLIYKGFKITPLSFPVGVGIAAMTVVIIVLSFISAFIIKRVPIINKLV